MRAQKLSGVKIKRILHVARGVIGRCVEGIEAMKFIFNLRTIGKSKTHATQDPDRAFTQQSQGMQATSWQKSRRQCRIDACQCSTVRGLFECLLFLFQSCRNLSASSIQQRTDFAFLLLRHILHPHRQGRQCALFTQRCHPRLIKGSRILCSRNRQQCIILHSYNVLFHTVISALH